MTVSAIASGLFLAHSETWVRVLDFFCPVELAGKGRCAAGFRPIVKERNIPMPSPPRQRFGVFTRGVNYRAE